MKRILQVRSTHRYIYICFHMLTSLLSNVLESRDVQVKYYFLHTEIYLLHLLFKICFKNDSNIFFRFHIVEIVHAFRPWLSMKSWSFSYSYLLLILFLSHRRTVWAYCLPSRLDHCKWRIRVHLKLILAVHRWENFPNLKPILCLKPKT